MSRAVSAFRPKTVALLLLVGVGAFLLLLLAIGQGWTGNNDRNGGEHAASNGLTGFAGLVQMLEATGHNVSLSRTEANYDDYGLLVLTPPHGADADELDDILDERRYVGPTLLILPKWWASRIPPGTDVEVEDGWVFLGDVSAPRWLSELPLADGGVLAVGETQQWYGYEASGKLPAHKKTQALTDSDTQVPDLDPLVTDSEGDILVGNYENYDDEDAWPVVVVFEPDLINNYGMADRDRAALAMEIVASALYYDPEADIIFDLTLSGLGKSDNLLTLAFRPPFLAATLCLLLVALIVAWRGFHRFGPPLAEAPAVVMGKRQLARNSAALVARVRRWHLLKQPYEDLIGRRLAAHFGIAAADRDAREQAIDNALAARGLGEGRFADLASNLRAASQPRDILRAASALRKFERTLTQ